jgi:hypothetical protein
MHTLLLTLSPLNEFQWEGKSSGSCCNMITNQKESIIKVKIRGVLSLRKVALLVLGLFCLDCLLAEFALPEQLGRVAAH